jgi:hypothetical protein
MDDTTRLSLGLPTRATIAARADAIATRLEREVGPSESPCADEWQWLRLFAEEAYTPVTVACKRR